MDAGLKRKSEPEGTLPPMLRVEISSRSSPRKADVWVGRVGSRALGVGASEEKAEDEGRPASPLRWVPGSHVQMNLAFLLVLWVSSLLPYPRGQFQ